MSVICNKVQEDVFEIKTGESVLVVMRQGAMVLCYNVSILTEEMIPLCVRADICQTEVDARNRLLMFIGLYCSTEQELKEDCLDSYSSFIQDRIKSLILRVWRISNVPKNEMSPGIFVPQKSLKIEHIYYMPDRLDYSIMVGDNDTVLAFSKANDTELLYGCHKAFLQTNREISFYEGKIEKLNRKWTIRKDMDYESSDCKQQDSML